jgi:2-haloacid dehalogenase
VTDLRRFEALTFDCYGTLIDWERGILDALDDLLGEAARNVGADLLMEEYARFEPRAQEGPFRPYRAVMEDVARAFGEAHGTLVDDGAAARFAASVGEWPPFPDTVGALQRLADRYRLAVVSNVDDDLFAGSAAMLGVDFADVVTAQQVRSYKPERAHFDEAIRRLGLPVDRVLHVAQSLYHDIAPAKELGFACVWVNRRAGQEGAGVTPAAEATPDLEVPSLAALADLVERANTSAP